MISRQLIRLPPGGGSGGNNGLMMLLPSLWRSAAIRFGLPPPTGAASSSTLKPTLSESARNSELATPGIAAPVRKSTWLNQLWPPALHGIASGTLLVKTSAAEGQLHLDVDALAGLGKVQHPAGAGAIAIGAGAGDGPTAPAAAATLPIFIGRSELRSGSA